MTEPTMTPTPPPPPPAAPTPTSATARPTGITILAILAAIFGVLGILGGIALIGIGGAAGAATGQAAFFGLGVVGGLLALAISIAYLAFAYGAWTLQPWAWTLGVAIAIIGIVWAVLQLLGGGGIVSTIINIAISGIVLYYLMQPNIKAALGRA